MGDLANAVKGRGVMRGASNNDAAQNGQPTDFPDKPEKSYEQNGVWEESEKPQGEGQKMIICKKKGRGSRGSQ